MERKVCYLKLAIEGIQKYICSTGKLKEMIGGSEIIARLASRKFYEPILGELGLEEDRDVQGLPGRYIVAQANAGALCLIVPDREKARGFLARASYELLEKYPGLPFYGGLREFTWSDDGKGRNAYAEARRLVDNEIRAQRSEAPVPCGSGLLPILKTSRLDGLPAVASRQKERVSLPSRAPQSGDDRQLARSSS